MNLKTHRTMRIHNERYNKRMYVCIENIYINEKKMVNLYCTCVHDFIILSCVVSEDMKRPQQ